MAAQRWHEVDSRKTEIGHALLGLPAELPTEIHMPHEPISTLEWSVPTADLSSQSTSPRSPWLFSPLSQTSISPLNTSPSVAHCSTSSSHPQDPSNQTSNEDVHLGSGQASYSSNAYTWESPMDLYSQEPTLRRGPSLSKLLETPQYELEGLMPFDLPERMRFVFESIIKQSFEKLSELEDPKLRAVLGPVHRIKPTLDTGLSALNSLVSGQVPHRLDAVISLLFVAYAIVPTLVDEQNRSQFTEALLQDDIEWMNAIACHEDRYAFQMLLEHRWLPDPRSAVCNQAYGSSSRGWRSLHPTRTPFAQVSIPFEEGRLDNEDEIGFRLRTGLNAQICQWYIDCEFRLWFSINGALT
ncbi:hypothetical protein GJ744_008174 [Endocarpon pusillum]|uniref:Uncharacterized protein n=1 Tax=Endocarpon pusillum TaxID=364733 RepID=A0A8H7AHL9_9EURO|nr:hypothetical protein GJ744_008174 [Endocarpon pusillum]